MCKTFFIDTLGCPKNSHDSEVLSGILLEAGYEKAVLPYDSDILVVNTCAFINDAKKESIEHILDFASLKAESSAILVITGCLSERFREELKEEIPEADIILGVNEYEELPTLLDGFNGQRYVAPGGILCDFDSWYMRELPANPYSMTLRLGEGCNNRCSYCVIPYIRGPQRSRKMEDILIEAHALAAAGCVELILIAQDTTAYGHDLYGRYMLPALLKELVKVDGIRWIRLMYCYEDKLSDELIALMRDEDKICAYIDMPIQHINDNVLKNMFRPSTTAGIKNTISKLRREVPDIHIRSTLIVGFPGESDEEFGELLDFVAEYKIERLGVFAYSREEGTPAADMDGQIEDSVKGERLDAIMRRQIEISLANNQKFIGKVIEVIVENYEGDGSYIGRSRYDAPEIDNSVIFKSDSELKIGSIVDVLIEDAFDYDLVGRVEWREE